MLLENVCLQGSHILEVKEEANGQMVDILLDSPSDTDGDPPEKKILRLKEVLLYSKREIPFVGNPVVRAMKVLQSPGKAYTAFSGSTTANYKIEIITNAGSRILEFADWTWHEVSGGRIPAAQLQEAGHEKVEMGFY